MANYPGSSNTDVNLYVGVNNLSTVLTDNPLTAGAVTVNVSDTTGFPTVGILTIDLEAIHYTGTTGTSFTGCTRGFDGTTGASHPVGTTVFHDIPAAHHNVLKDELIAVTDDLRDTFTGDLDDGATVGATAVDVKERLDQIVTVITALTGEADWKTVVAKTMTGLVALDGTRTYTASQPMGGFIHTGLGAGTANGHSVRFQDINNGLGSGRVLQVVQGTQAGSSTTTSTTFVDTGTTVTITPQRTDSQILLIASGSLGQSDISNGVARCTLARGSTNLGAATTGMCTIDTAIGAVQMRVPAAMTYFDSPATTSATTYKVQISTNNVSHTTTWGLGQQQIIAIEIGV